MLTARGTLEPPSIEIGDAQVLRAALPLGAVPDFEEQDGCLLGLSIDGAKRSGNGRFPNQT